MRLVKDKLPEAHVCFIDEVYKGSSAIANTLLTAINERIFHNDGRPQLIPLQTLIAASNELPSESEELAAFHDRFLLKYEVKYICERGSFLRMLSGYTKQEERTILTLDELAECQEQVKAIKVTDEVAGLIDRIRFELQKEGIIVSDRVFNTSQDLVRAETWLMGLKETPPEALGICQHAYWDEPKKSRNVKMTVLRASSKEMLEIEQAYEEAMDLIRVKTKMDDETTELKEGLETRKKLQKIVKVLTGGIDTLEKKKLPVFKYKSMLEAAKFRLQTIDQDLMGSDMEEISKKKGR
jgi:MoxR-like ATPase